MASMWMSDSQKIGVIFCSGGGFFLIGGVMLFFDRAIPLNETPARLREPSFRTKHAGADLASKPQILFLIGLTIIIGPSKTLLFFARKQKAKGTAAFFGGLALILLRWPLIGFCVELYGIMVLFGDFLGTIAAFARNIPVIGPYIGAAVDRSGVGRRNAELPV
ncbi:Vesicle transport protein GOT1 [Colletotrichum trifolii]|uniref:Vesicle transport protein GOT1 n=1 Tax=Colletotrichum trifolii TaxID=5466 RepID=A0A4R8RIY5_COLTR|nr:Vesicle transport protein GOT1 [Colletotrichum trifolii]